MHQSVLHGLQHTDASTSEAERSRALIVEASRRVKQAEYQERYERAQREEKKRAFRRHGLRLTREITDEVRNWLMEYK